MLPAIEQLIRDLEAEQGHPLSSKKLAFLRSIRKPSDIRKQQGADMQDIAYDAAVALGASDDRAAKMIGE